MFRIITTTTNNNNMDNKTKNAMTQNVTDLANVEM